MAKQKRRAVGGGTIRRREAAPPLDQAAINELVAMLEQGQYVEAIMAIEQLREAYPREAILPKLLGMAYSQVGELSAAALNWEEATRLDPHDASPWRLLTGIYQAQGRSTHALRALRRYVAEDPEDEQMPEIEALLGEMEALLGKNAERMGASRADAERGTLLVEQGSRALEEGNSQDAARRFREASRVLPGWTVPRDNLALAQFLLGKRDEAVAIAEGVLADHPEDGQALIILARFMVMLGRREEALAHGERLWTLTQAAFAGTDDEDPPSFEFEKAADAFAVLDWDERVVTTLERRPREELSDRGLLLLGAALANTGRKSTALGVLQELEPLPRATRMADALRLNETPPGGRFSALNRDELLPLELVDQLAGTCGQGSEAGEEERAAAREAVLARADTVLPAFMGSLWLDDETSSAWAVGVLLGVGAPEATEAVRTFAFGRLGPDDPRLHAALALRDAGLVDTSRPLILWQEGRYQEVRLPRYELAEEDAPARPYPPAIARLMDKALERHARDDLTGAARLYRQVLEQDPALWEAEQHLGLLALFQGDRDTAATHLARALELAPAEVLPRTILASLRIGERRLSEARDLLIPLTDRTRFQPNELASYLFATAELAAADGDAGRARGQLRLLLAYLPEHPTARLRLRQLEEEEDKRQEAAGEQKPGVGQLLQSAGNLFPFGPRQ